MLALSKALSIALLISGAVLAVIALALLGVAGFYFWTNYKHDDEITQQLDDTTAKFKNLLNRPLHPGGERGKVDNIQLVRDENKLPITSSNGLWAHIVKSVFTTQDGLGTLQYVLTVTLDPLTIGKPHIVARVARIADGADGYLVGRRRHDPLRGQIRFGLIRPARNDLVGVGIADSWQRC
jgi:hypothetical protein